MFNILVAESEPIFGQAIAELFPDGEFNVDHVDDGFNASELVRSRPYDAILLDRRITRISVYEICKQVRHQSTDAAVFILHSENTMAEEQLAVQYGVDQCISHPVELRDLNARVRAVLRRRKPTPQQSRLACHDLVLDGESGLVTKGGNLVELRPMEFVLLEFFMRNQGRVFSCSDLWCNVWKRKGTPSDSVRAHVAMLRKKICDPGVHPILTTIIGRGYKLEQPK